MAGERDSLLPCRQLQALGQEIADLAALDQAPRLAARINAELRGLAAMDLGGRLLARLISDFNDRLAIRIIELVARRHRFPAVAWCWLAFGSEGRHEQTFVSDQDNGLVFAAADSTEAAALRELFLPFADEVNHRLADCGATLCPGGIMAGNPAWCLSLAEWRERFIDWVRRPEPQALLNASIFFDMRPLHGNLELGEELLSLQLALCADSPAFQHLMAANALQAEAPLNFRGEIVTSDEGKGHAIDLKKFGTRIFVDAARIFALAAQVRPVDTSRRLREGGLAAGLPAADIEAAEAAFAHLLRIRLTSQLKAPQVAGEGSSVALDSLNPFDRAVLKESLRQAKRLQQRLKLNYSL
jgi:CBS domain-containing protein